MTKRASPQSTCCAERNPGPTKPEIRNAQIRNLVVLDLLREVYNNSLHVPHPLLPSLECANSNLSLCVCARDELGPFQVMSGNFRPFAWALFRRFQVSSGNLQQFQAFLGLVPAEMCRGFLLYRFWRILPGIFLEDFSGHFFPQK